MNRLVTSSDSESTNWVELGVPRTNTSVECFKYPLYIYRCVAGEHVSCLHHAIVPVKLKVTN